MTDLQTAHQALLNWAEKTPDRVFLHQPVAGELRTYTWLQSADNARRIASALLGLGLQPGDRVAILGKNSAEWILADVAIAMAGMISVPIYPTAGANTIAYIIGQSDARAIFVGKLDDQQVVTDAIPKSLPRIAFPYPIDNCQYHWQSLVDDTRTTAIDARTAAGRRDDYPLHVRQHRPAEGRGH